VIVVGLPYPDINDPVLKEKMKFMNDAPDAVLTGNDYYHSVCMRSLGQAIGRSIRHISDYAAILLVDSRYASDKRIWESLPNWLKNASGKAVTRQPCFDSLLSGLQHFFSSKS
jgi:chromosome transmission fidelity protein 1